MRLRKFTGTSAAAALREVKRELGEDALILRTREITGGGVEVTAATDVDQVMDPLPEPPPGRGAACVVPAPARSDDLQAMLSTFGAQLRRLERRLPGPLLPAAAVGELSGEAAELSESLAHHGVPALLARELATRFGTIRGDGESFDDAIARAIEEWVPSAEADRAGGIRFLVGPTGSGKTTTVAKLAAEDVLAGRPRPLLLNADTVRLGAGQQLASIGRLLDVEVRDVTSTADLRAHLENLEAGRPVYVDTPGLSSEEATARGVRDLVDDCACDVEVTAVVSATTARSALQRAWAQIERLHPRSGVVTHMDESDEPGIACSWLGELGVPLRWLGTGQRVPEDLASATGANLALWLVAA